MISIEELISVKYFNKANLYDNPFIELYYLFKKESSSIHNCENIKKIRWYILLRPARPLNPFLYVHIKQRRSGVHYNFGGVKSVILAFAATYRPKY